MSTAALTYSSTIVGALACQRNSFLKTLKTKVVSANEYTPIQTSRDKQNKNKKVKEQSEETSKGLLYALELEDTILFPEGGGQPCDYGTITLPNDDVIDVKSVLRDKLKAIHVTDSPIREGTEITLNVDWERRIDVMQQHTGQHLLSAVLDTYNLETLSWSMGDVINYIELPQKISDEIVEEVNRKVNDIIFEGLPISLTTPDQHGGEVDITHIPDDYDLSKGIVRIVKIGDLDANPCCGTHLSSTSEVQAISLLNQTNVRGGNSRLHFICGSRVYKYLRKQYDILKTVSGNQLSCQVDEVADKVAALNLNYRKSTSRESNLLKELAAIEANKIFQDFLAKGQTIGFAYREDSNAEFILLLQKELTTLVNTSKDCGIDLNSSQTVVLLNGDYASGTGGMVKIIGPKAQEIQAELKQRISNLKGGGKGASFQGKISKYEKGELDSTLKYLESLRNS
ncbi:uncharacterized protein PRCAT00000890001 [Priceomyces carsonii]|uniref:uncharacterized protein n=1 Tax=Priceomyces carsonii TaxID=28549 RepID=UPI002ED7FE42|nr:unnamed protein product [Priceomyces carsonii]